MSTSSFSPRARRVPPIPKVTCSDSVDCSDSVRTITQRPPYCPQKHLYSTQRVEHNVTQLIENKGSVYRVLDTKKSTLGTIAGLPPFAPVHSRPEANSNANQLQQGTHRQARQQG